MSGQRGGGAVVRVLERVQRGAVVQHRHAHLDWDVLLFDFVYMVNVQWLRARLTVRVRQRVCAARATQARWALAAGRGLERARVR